MTDMSAIFTSRRSRQPLLILTSSMQRDAFQADWKAAVLRRDMRAVHRIEAEAARATTAALRKAVRK